MPVGPPTLTCSVVPTDTLVSLAIHPAKFIVTPLGRGRQRLPGTSPGRSYSTEMNCAPQGESAGIEWSRGAVPEHPKSMKLTSVCRVNLAIATMNGSAPQSAARTHDALGKSAASGARPDVYHAGMTAPRRASDFAKWMR